jgi:hypothetical protein
MDNEGGMRFIVSHKPVPEAEHAIHFLIEHGLFLCGTDKQVEAPHNLSASRIELIDDFPARTLERENSLVAGGYRRIA